MADRSNTMVAGSPASLAPSLELEAGPVTRDMLCHYRDVSGDPNPLHVDPEAARRAGFPDVIAHGMLSMAFLGRMLTDAYGPTAVRAIKLRFTAVTPVDIHVRCTGFDAAQVENGTTTIAIETDAGGKTTTSGSAVIAPRR